MWYPVCTMKIHCFSIYRKFSLSYWSPSHISTILRSSVLVIRLLHLNLLKLIRRMAGRNLSLSKRFIITYFNNPELLFSVGVCLVPLLCIFKIHILLQVQINTFSLFYFLKIFFVEIFRFNKISPRCPHCWTLFVIDVSIEMKYLQKRWF